MGERTGCLATKVEPRCGSGKENEMETLQELFQTKYIVVILAMMVTVGIIFFWPRSDRGMK